MFRWPALPVLATALWLADASAQSAATAPPPANFIFVPHPNAYRLAKHPSLPLLYLGCSSAPESRNLVTFRLGEGGAVLTNSARTFPDYFTDDGKNPTNLYSVQRPIVLPQEKVLILAATPNNYILYHMNRKAQHIAVVALDEQGQPARLLKAFRTTHTEGAVIEAVVEPTNRRLFLSYNSYYGWCAMDRDGVPSVQFRLMPLPWNFWDFVFVPEWGRFLGVARGTDLCNFRVTPDGSGVEFFQMSVSRTGTFGACQVSPGLRKVYVLNGPDYSTISIYPLDPEGRFVSVPLLFALGQTAFLRIATATRRLYSITEAGTIRSQPLAADGYPTGTAEVFQVACGSIRDVIVDEPSGKVYVACTEPPTKAK